MTQQKFEKRRKRRNIAKDKGRNNDSNSRMKNKLENKNPQGQVKGRHKKEGSYKRFNNLRGKDFLVWLICYYMKYRRTKQIIAFTTARSKE